MVATNKGNYDEVINATIAAYRAKKAPQIVQIYERGFMSMLLSDAIVPVQDLLTEKKQKVDFGRLHQAGRELLPVQGQADEHALQLLDADPVLQQGAVREGGLRRSRPTPGPSSRSSSTPSSRRARPNAARRWPATISGA